MLLVFSTFASAEIPLVMNYQGVLTDGTGTAVPDGSYNLTFNIYEVAEGGSSIWAETQPVEVNKGIFSVFLGSVNPLDIGFGAQCWLGISIESEPELVPRAFISSTAYAFKALSVDGYTNFFPAEGNVGIGTPAPAERLDVNGAIRIGPSAGDYDGTIRWTGSDFEGFDGSVWKSFTTGGSGTLPSGDLGRTLRHDGMQWVADSLIFNNGTYVGIGTTSPEHTLHVKGLSRFETPGGDLSISTPGGWPGLIAYPHTGGNRRDIVFDASGLYLSASSSEAAPYKSNGIMLEENGRVAMGVDTPLEKLHIKADGPTYAYIEAPSGYASGVALGVDNTVEWRMLYHPGEGTLQMYKEGSGEKMVIGDGGRVGINTEILGGTDMLEVHSTDPAPGDAAVTGYSYFPGLISTSGGIGLAGIHWDDGVGGTGVYGEATGPSDMGGYQVGVYGYTNDGYGVYSDGTLGSSGPIVSLASTRDFGKREVYGVQATGNWFEDFGTGRLDGGEATVRIDPVFAQTVNLAESYHVFLTPLGDAGLYVTEKDREYFTVRARGEGGSDVSFDYRVVAKRRGHESKRLEKANDPSPLVQGMKERRARVIDERAKQSVE